MRFWQSLHFCPAAEILPLSRAAEAAGMNGVSLGDHLVEPWLEEGSIYPYSADGKPPWPLDSAFPDPWVTAAAIGQATTTLGIHTSVYILPLRELLNTAKAMATAAYLTDNRLLPGVGVGWLRAEFDAAGSAFTDRGRRTNEMLEALPRLLRGERISAPAAGGESAPIRLTGPLPSEPVPILVGGESAPALRRVARADGWVSGPLTIDELSEALRAVRRSLAAVGRRMADPFRVMVTLRGKPSPGLYERAEEAGVTDVQVSFASRKGGVKAPLESKIEQIREFAESFIAKGVVAR